jgi:hypothetical protein
MTKEIRKMRSDDAIPIHAKRLAGRLLERCEITGSPRTKPGNARLSATGTDSDENESDFSER